MRKTYSIAVLFILIASIVRIWNLEWNPAWYTDEGTHIEIARHLIQGENHYLGITDSYLIAARLPLFEHILAVWFRFVGISMLSLRILTSFMGIISTALIYRVVASASDDKRFAIVAMGLFAIYPQAVIYSRFGFSYNLLPILILSGIWNLNRYRQALKVKYLIYASLLFGLGTLSDFIAFSFFPPFILIILSIRPKHSIIATIGVVAPFTVYALFELYLHPDIFLYDLTYTLYRAGGIPFTIQFENIIKNIQVLLTETWWIVAGVIGYIWIQPRQFRWTIISITILPILISGRTIALYNLSAYYMIPFLPFFVIGVSALLTYGIPQIFQQLSASISSQKRITSGVFVILFIVVSWNLIGDIQNEFTTSVEHFLINADEAHHVQDILIDYTNSKDIIIVSPTLAWMFDAKVTDFQLSSLSQSIDGVHFPAKLYPDRFAFDVDYTHATYAIVDNLWRDWGAIHMPSVANMFRDIQNWELIFEVDTIQVYHNLES